MLPEEEEIARKALYLKKEVCASICKTLDSKLHIGEVTTGEEYHCDPKPCLPAFEGEEVGRVHSHYEYPMRLSLSDVLDLLKHGWEKSCIVEVNPDGVVEKLCWKSKSGVTQELIDEATYVDMKHKEIADRGEEVSKRLEKYLVEVE